MELKDAQNRFIQSWGTLGNSWGINRTMAQIHALLLISPTELSAEEVMEALVISRGNANMNLRALIDWNLVEKVYVPGERKEFFRAEKDMWEITKRVTRERRKRELAPVLKVLEEIQEIEGPKTPEKREFENMTKNLSKFVVKADKMMDRLVKADEHWFFALFMRGKK